MFVYLDNLWISNTFSLLIHKQQRQSSVHQVTNRMVYQLLLCNGSQICGWYMYADSNEYTP